MIKVPYHSGWSGTIKAGSTLSMMYVSEPSSFPGVLLRSYSYNYLYLNSPSYSADVVDWDEIDEGSAFPTSEGLRLFSSSDRQIWSGVFDHYRYSSSTMMVTDTIIMTNHHPTGHHHPQPALLTTIIPTITTNHHHYQPPSLPTTITTNHHHYQLPSLPTTITTNHHYYHLITH